MGIEHVVGGAHGVVDGLPEGFVLGGWVIRQRGPKRREVRVVRGVVVRGEVDGRWEGRVPLWQGRAVREGEEAHGHDFVEEHHRRGRVFGAGEFERSGEGAVGGGDGVCEDVVEVLEQADVEIGDLEALFGEDGVHHEVVLDEYDVEVLGGLLEVGAGDEVDFEAARGEVAGDLERAAGVAECWVGGADDDGFFLGAHGDGCVGRG